MQPENNPEKNSFILARYISLAGWIGAVLVGLFIPLSILSSGFIPQDDAMRHVAKVLSSKSWPEIVVVRDGFGNDEHPGWHAILGAAHRWMGWDADALINFSVAAPFFLFWIAMLAWRKRPEAMLLALFAASLCAPASFTRTLFGRPFVFILIVFVMLLQMWARSKKISPRQMLASVALVGAAVWVHGSWYLFGILIAGFFLVGEWRKTFQLTACWLGGVLLGAALTGNPTGYLHETTAHLFGVFGGAPLQRMLVTELRPDSGDLIFVVVIALMLVWRVARGEWRRDVIFNPVFAIALMGWLLGLKVARFWVDWGMPAAILWLAMELEDVLKTRWPQQRLSTLALAGVAAAAVFIATTRDIAGRWTNDLTAEYVTPETPGIAGWLPDKGGIIYSSDMRVFFTMFYKNPHADWRYMLGFESGIMPEEDFNILRKIQWNWYTPKAYAPWVKKMRPEDRMMFRQETQPVVAGLEWYYAATDTWIGRLPRKKTGEVKP